MKTYKIKVVKTITEIYEVNADGPFTAGENYGTGDMFASYINEVVINDIEEM